MGKTRLELGFLLALLVTFNLAAHAAQGTSALSSCLSKPLPRALEDSLSPLSREQQLYYGMFIRRAGGLRPLSESVLDEFCTTARLLCSASLQRSKWGARAGEAKTTLPSSHTTAALFPPLLSGWFKEPAAASSDTTAGVFPLLSGWFKEPAASEPKLAEEGSTSSAGTEEPAASESKAEEGNRSQTNPDIRLLRSWPSSSRKDNEAGKPEGIKHYFRETDLAIGAQLVLPSFIYKPASGTPSFLPASMAMIALPPFDMQHLTDLVKLFRIPSDAEMAKMMEATLKACTMIRAVGRGKKYDDTIISSCITSMEAQIEFVVSMLNAPEKKIQALTNSEAVGSEGDTVTVVQTTELAAGHDAVDCHDLVFPFKVMGCHRIKQSKAMVVKVRAEEGGKDMDLLVACHRNTTFFNPHHDAFAQLRSSPGHTEICHFLPNTDIMWVPL